MCGIAGFFNREQNYVEQKWRWNEILGNMSMVLNRRGPDEQGTFLSEKVGFSHARLSIIDLVTGRQPIVRDVGGHTFAIVYNGELYNMQELKKDLLDKGWKFETTSDSEVMLFGFIEYGPDFVKRMNGIFACAIYSERDGKVFLFRDRFGIKPLFYTVLEGTLVFGSEIKALFEFPGVRPLLDKKGLNEVFSVGPAKTYGCGVFKNIEEVLPGYYYVCDGLDLKREQYWCLESRPHTDTYEETVEKTSFLVQDAIKRQMVSDVPICTFLSGGVDSSLVSAVCSNVLKEQGEQLTTFSFDFVDNDKFFKANAFQPSMDRPWVDRMVKHLDSNHIYLECENVKLADYLYEAVDAKDLPGMGDVDASLLYFCSKVKEHRKVALTGECADEIFGGYPWFHKKECFEANTFPWTMDLEARKVLLSQDFLNELHMDDYVNETYSRSVLETPKLAGESRDDARRREITFLNMKWFMQTLLDRMDRTSMYSGLEARVPFADHRIVDYVFNVPWDMKCKDGVVKGLLRETGRGLLPDDVLFRKKSPYPKTYNPAYEILLGERLTEVVEDSSSPINQFIDKEKLKLFIKNPSDYGKPWYGQLMAGPQMLAYMLQINYWMTKYKIDLV